MTKYIPYIFLSVVLTLIQGCSQILEPVILVAEKKQSLAVAQEDLNVEIIPLTFNNAMKANKSSFARQLMIKGSGDQARVVDENIFLTASVPDEFKDEVYKLGIGDELTFLQLNNYQTEDTQWPPIKKMTDYTLGVGDKLSFVQFSGAQDRKLSGLSANLFENDVPGADVLISTDGVVGSNGKVLLLGIGSLNASNRTLNDVRNEVRNILIRNGRAPNFQLEITDFKSKKAYLSSNTHNSKIIPINNIPVSLQEIALESGLRESIGNAGLLTLKRDKKDYRLTAGQLFENKGKEIFIQDKDQISINITQNTSQRINVIVGIKGKILLPGIGSLNVLNKTLNTIHSDIQNRLLEKGFRPDFQLELSKSKNKKVYLINKNVGSSVIPLSNRSVTLKHVLLESKSFATSVAGGVTVVSLIRNKKDYHLPLDMILEAGAPSIWLQDGDQIEVKFINYKPGQVYVLSGTNMSLIMPIDPSQRESLANVLFTTQGALSNQHAKRSEVYLLRGRKPTIAYHLDAQNVSRILVAAKAELRPNDIIYVAERPIISFTRFLNEITPLRMLIRDIEANNIP
jgi:protein involved in polysaccharide export with SLBB domain